MRRAQLTALPCATWLVLQVRDAEEASKRQLAAEIWKLVRTARVRRCVACVGS
jgi:hypothetical protein